MTCNTSPEVILSISPKLLLLIIDYLKIFIFEVFRTLTDLEHNTPSNMQHCVSAFVITLCILISELHDWVALPLHSCSTWLYIVRVTLITLLCRNIIIAMLRYMFVWRHWHDCIGDYGMIIQISIMDYHYH